MLAQIVHVDVAVGLHPVFVGLDGERSDQEQAVDAGSILPRRQPEEGERLFDVLLDPGGEPGIARRPFGHLCSEIGLGNVAPVIEPAQLLQAVVAVLARQMIERVPEEGHVAALPGRLRDDLADRSDQPSMIVGHDQFV
ncbi:hypothetical protein GCM10010869_25650 [Mesorhizobium tianshanense]|nr:hypothetical protein GCM10010869_25650 [Mesorhizobium tianshanense]